jgi:hypothetical protein
MWPGRRQKAQMTDNLFPIQSKKIDSVGTIELIDFAAVRSAQRLPVLLFNEDAVAECERALQALIVSRSNSGKDIQHCAASMTVVSWWGISNTYIR